MKNSATRSIIIASPHGFCAGVERAVQIAETTLKRHPKPVYCLRQIVHNSQIVESMRARGMVFVDDIRDVPGGATILFSAHGVSPAVRKAAVELNLRTIDATCPFVTKVHDKVRHYAEKGYSILLVGDRHHDEISGVAGEASDCVKIVETESEAETVTVKDPGKVAVVTQTTLSLDELSGILAVLRRRFTSLRTPSKMDICYATQNRQEAVRLLAPRVDVFIILGSENSSNSNRLAKVAREGGCRAHLASSIEKLSGVPLDEATNLGLTAGASTPECFVRESIDHLKARGFDRVHEFIAVKEITHFPGV